LACTRAAGAALVQNRECTLLGQTPPAEEMLQLAEWLHSTRAADDVFATEALQNDYSDAKSYASIASGVLAISLSRVQSSYLLWFRPEVAQTVRWAGELTGAQQEGKAGAINPHRSFNVWQQEVRGKSLPWDSIEVETASNLRNGILNFVLRIAEERAALSAGLERLQARLRILDKSKSEFLNLISHELRTPLNGLLGIGDLLLGDLKEGPKENEFREMFEQSRRRILSIIDDALLLTEIEVEAERFASKPVALKQVLRTALDRTADFAGSSGVKFELERSHPGSVLAEESLLIKAIQSLLETTVKFSKTGEAVQLKFFIGPIYSAGLALLARPECRDRILQELPVRGDQDHVFGLRLRDQHSVKGIGMKSGQLASRQRVLLGDGKRPESSERQSGAKEIARGFWQLELPRGCFNCDLPRRSYRNKYRIDGSP